MEHVHKGKKAQSAVRVFETTLGTPGKTAKNSGTVTAGVLTCFNPMNFHDIPIKDPAIFVTLGAQQQDQALENGVHALRP